VASLRVELRGGLLLHTTGAAIQLGVAGLTFALLLLGTILLAAAVSFLPALAMGPVVELLQC
jgi:K+-transporting ATPase A subunit